MEPKRELSSIDLAALVTELHRYEGAKVDKAYLYGDDLLRLKLRDFDRGRVELLVEVGELKRAHVADPDRVPDAPGRPPNFAKMLRNRLSGADLAGVEQYEFDRILVFEFERGDADTTLVAELFGEGNVAALDESGEVIGSLETVRLKSRTVAPGAQYEFPSSRLDPLSVSFDLFSRRMDDSDSDVVRTLATQLNLGGLYAEEVCARAGVEKTTPIEAADEEVYRAVYDALSQLRERLASGDFDPRVYAEPPGGPEERPDAASPESASGSESGRVVDVTPFPLTEREGLESQSYDSFNAALDAYFYRLDLDDGGDGGRGEEPAFEEEIARKKRIIEQQENAIDGFREEADRERRRAELLYENYDLVDEVLSTVQSARDDGVAWETIGEKFEAGADRGIQAAEAVVDVDGSEGTVTLDLGEERVTVRADVGVERNADLLYQEAKRIEGKKEGALEAIQETREELEQLQARKERYEREDGDGDGDADDEGGEEAGEDGRSTDWLARSSIPVRESEEWYERFRWFHTSDDFLVVGGRSADQNEELVKKYLESNDRFLHAQAHGGPVTILKATGPSERSREVDFPDRSLEEAAQFAVSYSSVWKDGRGAGDAYAVTPDQVSKTPESGEYIEKGGFVIRGDRTYYRDVAAEVAVGVQVEPESRVLGGPPSAVEPRTVTSLRLRPGKYAQNDAAMLCYREFKSRFEDESFVRKVASADRIQEFLPPGGSELLK
ncbi:MAG: ribosome rescue protein RqcH [Haloferacaceae archaeon]